MTDQPGVPQPPSSEPTGEAARAAALESARRQVDAKLKFKRAVLSGAFVVIICIVIWLLAGRGYFWPAWVMFGLAISVFWMGVSAYGPRERTPTQEEIDSELRRQQGR